MVFADRTQAGKQLAELLYHDPFIQTHIFSCVVMSLVRGGAPVGYEISQKLNCPHFPLIAKKIVLVTQPEIAIGAVAGNKTYINDTVLLHEPVSQNELREAEREARYKALLYEARFPNRPKTLKHKVVVLVDDGIATGSSLKASCLFLKEKGVSRIIIATPVAPADFVVEEKFFDRLITLHTSENFRAVGQFYQNFEQLTEERVLQYFEKNS